MTDTIVTSMIFVVSSGVTITNAIACFMANINHHQWVHYVHHQYQQYDHHHHQPLFLRQSFALSKDSDCPQPSLAIKQHIYKW